MALLFVDFLIFLLIGIPSYLIAQIGKKRHIGFKYAFVLNYYLTPLIGILIILDSKKLSDESALIPSKAKRTIGLILTILAYIYMSIIIPVIMTLSLIDEGIEIGIHMLLGFIFFPLLSPFTYISLGQYLIKIGKGRYYDANLQFNNYDSINYPIQIEKKDNNPAPENKISDYQNDYDGGHNKKDNN